MLKGRLGLEGAKIAHADRHGVVWLTRGNLVVEDGTLRFATAGTPDGLPRGDYAIPYQMLSCIVLEPGTTVSHDALRLMSRHGTGLVAAGTDGVRMYASMPFGPDSSARARRQAALWADAASRNDVARRLYAWRLGTVLPSADIAVLRGIEGARMRETYAQLSRQFGLSWRGRRYDRAAPEAADLPNQAINHAATAVRAAAMVAVAISGTIPQLGFIHEDSGSAFALDVADLFRDTVVLPIAFGAARSATPNDSIERVVRRIAGAELRKLGVVQKMLDRIKALFDSPDGETEKGPNTDADDGHSHA